MCIRDRAQVTMIKQLEDEKRALKQIGNNINQIAKNSYRMMSSCDEELEEVERLLKELITKNEEVINKIWHQQ